MATILVVCTGNICRSPIAQGFLRKMLADRGIEGVDVESAGVSGLDGYPAVPEAVGALAPRNVDISAHLARRLNRRMAESADLVVAMAASHREAIGRLAPASADRTFTLKELVHLLDRSEPRPNGGGPGERLQASVSAARAMRERGAARDLGDEDIPDPLGLGPEAFKAVAWQLESLIERLVDEVFGPARMEASFGSEMDDGQGSGSSSPARADEGEWLSR